MLKIVDSENKKKKENSREWFKESHKHTGFKWLNYILKNSVRTGGDKWNDMAKNFLHYVLNGNINLLNNSFLIHKEEIQVAET